jgi:hypothetical protein
MRGVRQAHPLVDRVRGLLVALFRRRKPSSYDAASVLDLARKVLIAHAVVVE